MLCALSNGHFLFLGAGGVRTHTRIIFPLFSSTWHYQKQASKGTLSQTSELYSWCIYTHCWKNTDLKLMASIRKDKYSPKKCPTAPVWQKGEGGWGWVGWGKSYLGNACLNGPLLKKGLPLLFSWVFWVLPDSGLLFYRSQWSIDLDDLFENRCYIHPWMIFLHVSWHFWIFSVPKHGHQNLTKKIRIPYPLPPLI